MLSRLRLAIARVIAFIRRDGDDRDLREELASHLAMREDHYLQQGLMPTEARRRARLDLGGAVQLREAHQDVRGLPLLDTLGRDVRYALRTLRHDSGTTASALLIIGLGLGACATVFSVVNTLLIRPLPFADAERLVWIANGTSDNLSEQTAQVSNAIDLRDQSATLVGVAGFSPFYSVGDVRLAGDTGHERVTEVPVTEEFFSLLGVVPVHGRLFSHEESLWNAPPVVLLDHGFWQRRFAADPAIVGQALSLNGRDATVVGVLPASFDFSATFTPGNSADVFSPFPLSPETNRRGNTLALVGRLAENTDVDSAAAEVTVVASRFPTGRIGDGPHRNGFRPHLTPLRERVSGSFRHALAVLAGAVGFLMLLVCANLSNLLLARGATRRREIAVRAALGAGRGRLVRQLLIEGVLLSVGGAALGLVLALLGTGLLSSLDNTAIPLLSNVRLDAMAFTFSAALALATGISISLLPAMHVSAGSPYQALTDGSRGSTDGASGVARRALVVAEVALVCVLLTGAGLLTRSLMNVLAVEPGFEAGGVVTLRVDPGQRYADAEARHAYFNEILDNVSALRAVEAAGLTDALPFGDNFGWRRWTATAEGVPDDTDIDPLIRMTDEGYFDAMQIPVQAGRTFTRADDASAEPVVILNDALARALFPNGDAVGRMVESSGQDRRVVGVVAGVRYFSLEQDAGLEMYLPLRQFSIYAVVDLVARSSRPATEVAAGLRTTLARIDPSLPTINIRTMDQLMEDTVFTRRSVVSVIVGFAAFGLVLAWLGLYAVIAYAVSQRHHEIGIRMALGATPGNVRLQILRETLRLAALGVAIGVPAAWMMARAIRGLFFDVQPADPVTVVVVLAVLIGVAALAGYLPARRASRIHAMTALRAD